MYKLNVKLKAGHWIRFSRVVDTLTSTEALSKIVTYCKQQFRTDDVKLVYKKDNIYYIIKQGKYVGKVKIFSLGGLH